MSEMHDYTYIAGKLADAGEFATAIEKDVIAVRVTDQACVVHPKWMTREQVWRLQNALAQILRKWEQED